MEPQLRLQAYWLVASLLSLLGFIIGSLQDVGMVLGNRPQDGCTARHGLRVYLPDLLID